MNTNTCVVGSSLSSSLSSYLKCQNLLCQTLTLSLDLFFYLCLTWLTAVFQNYPLLPWRKTDLYLPTCTACRSWFSVFLKFWIFVCSGLLKKLMSQKLTTRLQPSHHKHTKNCEWFANSQCYKLPAIFQEISDKQASLWVILISTSFYFVL